MQLIKAWLNGAKDYTIGARLYKEFGGNNLLKKSFAEKETPFKKKQLVAAMQALLDAHTPPVHDDALEPETNSYLPPSATEKKWSGESVKDETERQLWEAYRTKAKQQDYLRHNLEAMGTDAERCEAAAKILHLDDDMDDIIAERDYYREHGKLKQKTAVQTIEDPLLIGKRMVNLERYIRREKATIAKEPDNTEAIKRLEKFTTELNIYNKKIGKDVV